MSRGRRGGRRQRRREQQARQAAEAEAAKNPNGPSGQGMPAASDSSAPEPPATSAESSPAPTGVASEARPLEPGPADAHPRPMSARELVARMEALRAHEEHASRDASSEAEREQRATADERGEEAGSAKPDASRHFTANGADWIAMHAGTGAGGTGRIAHARLEAIRFAPAAQPEEIAAEVLLPHARLDDLYDDELVALLERGLRSRTGNG